VRRPKFPWAHANRAAELSRPELQRDALEVFAEMSDAIFGLLILNRRHEPRNGVRAGNRVEHAVSRSIGFADLELVGHSVCQLSAETVRLLHFARITKRVGRAIMLIM